MSDETSVDELPNFENANHFTHLTWSPSGPDLAMIDTYGRISIYQISMALNRLSAMRTFTTDLEDNLGAIVGLMWLNSDRHVRLSSTMVNFDAKESSSSPCKDLQPSMAINGINL